MMSSRVIVKNLPQKCSEEKLRDLFSSCGEVTDVKMMKTRSGTFRKFGFIGFSSESHATSALSHYHNTFIGASKIEVEIAKPFGDHSLSRPWSKYSQDPAHKEKEEEKKKEKAVTKTTQLGEMMKEYESLEGEKEFQAFLDVHEHKTKVKTWSDTISGREGDEKGRGKHHGITPEDEKGCGKDDVNTVVKERMGKLKGKGLNLKEDGGVVRSSDAVREREDAATSHTMSDLSYLKTKVLKDRFDLGSHDPTLDTSSESDSSEEEDDTPPLPLPPISLATTPHTIKMLGLPFRAKEDDIKTFFHPLQVAAIRFTQDPLGRPSGRAYVDFHSEEDVAKALKRNKDCIFHRYIELFRDDLALEKGHVFKDGGGGGREELKTWQLKASLGGGGSSSEVESIVESGRIFVRNLSFTTQEGALSDLFEKYGPLTEVTLPLDKVTNKATGFGFVTFMLPEHAEKAYQELDGQIFQGRLLHLLPAHAKRGQDQAPSQQHSSFKKKKELKMKSDAGNTHNWNSLFLGSNAVVDVIAEKYSTEKSDILDSSSRGSVAVRVALGETQIVAETREFLSSQGVNLEVFEQARPKRSKNTILVKNLQSGTRDSDIHKLFQPFGQLLRVVLPPAGISALVEFAEANHAKAAFSKLAYTNFKHLPLYLEWAPDDVFAHKHRESSKKEEDGVMETNNKSTKQVSSKILVRNIPFEASKQEIQDLFCTYGGLKMVRLPKNLAVTGGLVSWSL